MGHHLSVLHTPAKIAGAIALAVSVSASGAEDRFAPMQWLVGEWAGEGGGTPGQGTGGFAFRPNLQGQVLVRTNYSEYPATADKPASRHEDLMIIYKDSGNYLRAEYWDSEGHVIRYSVQALTPDEIQFTSSMIAGSPSYRLTYKKDGPAGVKINFEIAPPNNPSFFKSYIEAHATRKKTS
jgi:hypothetical protein